MRTVLYIEWTRKKSGMIHRVLWIAGVILALFLICTLVDIVVPGFNSSYMKWPELLKDLLGIGNWSSHLFLNIWQFVALVYPFYLMYTVMTGVAQGITEEDRLETMVYLRNVGIKRKDIIAGKTCVWFAYAIGNVLVLLILTGAFALVLRAPQAALRMAMHYAGLGLLCVLYMAIACFAASCNTSGVVSADSLTGILIVPCLISRIPAIVRFFAELLILTGRQGNIVDGMTEWGERLRVFTILSPISWCWPGVDIQGVYVICAIIITIILAGTAYSIYTHKE